MFTGNAMLSPGQELRKFTVRRPETRETENGRVVGAGGETRVGEVEAALAAARPEEIERWRQLQHPVTHKVIMQGPPPPDMRPGDVLETGGRRLHVQAMPYDVGGLGHWTVIYCDERMDLG